MQFSLQDPVLDESLTAVETVLASGSAAAQAARQYAQSATESADNLASQVLSLVLLAAVPWNMPNHKLASTHLWECA